MPFDASSDPYGGGLSPDPASTKAGVDPDLNAAGTGAKSAVVDDKTVFHKDESTDVHKDADPAAASTATPKVAVDLHLDDAGRGAKVDPALHHDDPVSSAKSGALGSALDHVGDHGHKDVILDGPKHVDVGAPGHGLNDAHDDHIKGLHGADHLHDDHDPLHGDHHDHGHDAHGHDAHSAVDHGDLHHH